MSTRSGTSGRAVVLALVATVLLALPAVVAAASERAKLTASDGAATDLFGIEVAANGDVAVVGAYQANANQGSAYVFTRTGSTWILQAKLTASDGAPGDIFGASVAVGGDTAVVGAPRHDVGASPDQGSAYVFTRTGSTWTQQAMLTASDGAPGDAFGASVAVSGHTAVVSATADDTAADAGAGSAYVFTRSAASWSQQAKLTASDRAPGDVFGESVAVSGDTAVVGNHDDPMRGSAYVFTRTGSTWSEQAKLTASDGAPRDQFGRSVAVRGDTAVMGAPFDDVGAGAGQGSAYVFTRTGSNWTERAKLTASDGAGHPDLPASRGDHFGISVAVDADTAVVGAYLDDVGANADQGSAYVFTRTGSTWTERAKLTASDGGARDQFGLSVAVSRNAAVVGAPGDDVGANADQGSAYVFTGLRAPARPAQPARAAGS